MNILTKASGTEIHADIWWVFETTNKNPQYRFDRRLLFQADRKLQEKAREDSHVKNIFRLGFFKGQPNRLNVVDLEPG